jgi:hypothetical protein
MPATFKRLTDFLVELGIEQIAHTQKNYLGHLISVYKLMQNAGYDEELCCAGLFHSIYGTEKFQGFRLSLDRRNELTELIGSRAERLATGTASWTARRWMNCWVRRASRWSSAIGSRARRWS